MGDFFSYLKGGAAVSAAPTKLLNTFYLVVHFLLWQAAKPSGDKCTPLCYLKLFGC